MDGWTGGFIDTQQSSAAFPHSGAEKGCYVYVRAQQSRRDRRNPDAAVPFVYDVRESDRRLRALCLIGPFDTTGDVKR